MLKDCVYRSDDAILTFRVQSHFALFHDVFYFKDFCKRYNLFENWKTVFFHDLPLNLNPKTTTPTIMYDNVKMLEGYTQDNVFLIYVRVGMDDVLFSQTNTCWMFLYNHLKKMKCRIRFFYIKQEDNFPFIINIDEKEKVSFVNNADMLELKKLQLFNDDTRRNEWKFTSYADQVELCNCLVQFQFSLRSFIYLESFCKKSLLDDMFNKIFTYVLKKDVYEYTYNRYGKIDKHWTDIVEILRLYTYQNDSFYHQLLLLNKYDSKRTFDHFSQISNIYKIKNVNERTWKAISIILGDFNFKIDMAESMFARHEINQIQFLLNEGLYKMRYKNVFIFAFGCQYLRFNNNTKYLFKQHQELVTLFLCLNRIGFPKDLRFIIGDFVWNNLKKK